MVLISVNSDQPASAIWLAVEGVHLDGLKQDVRYAGRTLLKRPGFAFAVTLTLALESEVLFIPAACTTEASRHAQRSERGCQRRGAGIAFIQCQGIRRSASESRRPPRRPRADGAVVTADSVGRRSVQVARDLASRMELAIGLIDLMARRTRLLNDRMSMFPPGMLTAQKTNQRGRPRTVK